MTLSIIILSYNTSELTKRCIESLLKLYGNELSKNIIEIIILDNASTDESVTRIKEEIKKAKNIYLFESKKNVGFSKGNNTAAKKAKGAYLLFLNSDTQVKEKGFLQMVEYIKQRQRIGILGGNLLNSDGSMQPSTGVFYNIWNVPFLLFGLEKIGFGRGSPSKISQVDWVSGACMLIKKDLFDTMNGFDERLFMYMEDMDFCFRAKKLGFKTFFYPNAIIIHKREGSSNRSYAIMSIYQGLLYFFKKHNSRLEYFIIKLLLRLKALFLIGIGTLLNDDYLKDTYKSAIKYTV